MIRLPITVVTLAASFALAACGGEDANDNDGAQTATAGDVERYCTLTKELDAAGEEIFSALGEDASPEEFQSAERRFVERHSRELDELREATPANFRPDVEKLIAGIRQRAGLEPAMKVSEREVSAAEERIQAFENRECN